MASAIEEALRKAKAAKALKAAKSFKRPDVGSQMLPTVQNAVRTQSASEARRLTSVVRKPRSADPVVAAAPSREATVQPRRKNPEQTRSPGYQTIPPGWEPPPPVPFPKRRTASPPRYPHLRDETPVSAPVPNKVTLAIAPNATLVWHGGPTVTSSLFRQPTYLGRLVSMASDKGAHPHDVVLGLDFGTSSTKVVVHDRTQSQAYAVPFRDAEGIDTFLLPARLYEDLGSYSLHGGPIALTDLKLSLIANPDDSICQERVVAYLALTIREVRGWLFSAYAETYAKTQVLWSLALGLPTDLATNGPLHRVFERLARVAWDLASWAGEITTGLCSKSLLEALDGCGSNQDLELIVMPENAAQIFGFVRSTQFDDKARNIFLIVDVGAGTVDSCLFRPVKGHGGRWSFEHYISAVEPNGVMNLHRHRVAWWQHQLSRYSQGVDLGRQLEVIKFATEHQAHIPSSFHGYMKGVDVSFSGKAVGPDGDFFRNRLKAQVKGFTLRRAGNRELLTQQDLTEVPFFLCGGGSRFGFYQALYENLKPTTQPTWPSAVKRELAIPDNLRADGLKRSGFDRLSVAYGLSLLTRADVVEVTPMQRLGSLQSDQRRGHYVDKDQM